MGVVVIIDEHDEKDGGREAAVGETESGSRVLMNDSSERESELVTRDQVLPGGHKTKSARWRFLFK